MSDLYMLDERGEPVPAPDARAWERAYDDERRQVALDDVGECRVSTVFQGMDHGWGRGAPVLWETLVMADDSELDGKMERYTSRADALAGHAAMVARVLAAVRSGAGPDEERYSETR